VSFENTYIASEDLARGRGKKGRGLGFCMLPTMKKKECTYQSSSVLLFIYVLSDKIKSSDLFRQNTIKYIFFFFWRYSPLWALTCRTIPLHFSLSFNSLHLLTPST
jgi:hypothetical protein